MENVNLKKSKKQNTGTGYAGSRILYDTVLLGIMIAAMM